MLIIFIANKPKVDLQYYWKYIYTYIMYVYIYVDEDEDLFINSSEVITCIDENIKIIQSVHSNDVHTTFSF